MTIGSYKGRFVAPRALTIALTLALPCLAGTAAAQSSSPSNTSGWAVTNTPVLQGPAACAATSLFSGGVVDNAGSALIDITVALRPQNKAQLDQLVHDLYTPGTANYHRFLSQAQSTALFAPSPQQAQAVADYLTQQGFANVAIAPNRMLVTAEATTTQAAQAFNTSLTTCTVIGKIGGAFFNATNVQVPASIAPVVDQVLGLQNVNQVHSDLASPQDAQANAFPGYPATTLASIYGANSLPAATNTEVGIIGWGDMTQPIASLVAMEQASGIAPVPTQVKVYGNPASTTDGGAISGADVEFEMDSQAIVGMTGGVKKLDFYAAYSSPVDAMANVLYYQELSPSPPLTLLAQLEGAQQGGGADNGRILQAINGAVTDDTAQVINMSFSGAECGAPLNYADAVFELGVAQGQTFVGSTGDNGAYPCFYTSDMLPWGPLMQLEGNGQYYGSKLHPSIGYPASSPYVVAVGGTSLYPNPLGGYGSETAWAFGGGGPSGSESKPFWQSSLTGTFRQTPDVAFDADGNTGIQLYHDGKTVADGGTSLSAPLFVGAWARLQSLHNNQLGFAAPMIYALASPQNTLLGAAMSTIFSGALNDVQTGNNGYYSAQPGWDNATGWGSFQVDRFNNVLASNPWILQSGNQSAMVRAPWQ